MTEVLRFPPAWLNKALQGLAFWVGHRCSIYSGWELSEGALVGELCNLIHAHLSDHHSLRCEQPHSKFLPKSIKRPDIGDKARVDLSIWKSVTKEGRKVRVPEYAIEVKRAVASKAKIDEDLRRLAAIVEESDGIRGILCVIAEGKLPPRFVTSRGFRKKGIIEIEGTNSSYQVIAALKASAYFNLDNIQRAHYCCAIEVMTNDCISKELEEEMD